MTFGKVMGGGLPCAAFGGRAEIMDRLAPVGPVYQAGTLSGNPLATAAGLATLRACTPEVYARVDSFAGALVQAGLGRAAPPPGCRTTCRARAACSPSSSAAPARCANFADAKDQSAAAYAAFFHAMLDGGVYLPPSAFEAWFLSAAHDEEGYRRIADAPCPPPRAGRRGAGP